MWNFKGKDTKKKEHGKRRKSKSSKGGGSIAQAQSSGSEPVSYTELPEDFGFLWSIDAIETNYDKHPPRILGVGKDKDRVIAKLWFPPIHTKQFSVVKPGDLYRWTENYCGELSGTPRPKNPFFVASIFFQARQDNFVACYTDCLREDFANLDVDWCYLGFNHRGEGLSEVETNPHAGYDVLAAPAKDSLWMPQVLPAVYDYNTKVQGVTTYSGSSGGLCGRLALLIGMAAFSTSVEKAENTVSKCFKFGDWKYHDAEIGIGRYPERGVVVRIYLDPDAADSTTSNLRSFEKGKYGPIFYTDPAEPADEEPSSHPGAPTYSLSSAASLAETGQNTPRGWGPSTSQQYTYTVSPAAISGRYSPSVTQSGNRSETEEGDEVKE